MRSCDLLLTLFIEVGPRSS